MKKPVFCVLMLALALSSLAAQQKYALVIGNGSYTSVTKLNNPVNDARDMEAALKGLGWTVELVLNGGQEQMEGAAIRLKNRLSASKQNYGFLFYAGHGVQSNGENFLIPVDANIQSESFLRSRAVSVQALLDELNAAGNALNIVVLDACRDNPFSWKRSGSRGLQVVSNQPADSIIVYATSAGSTAEDGTGRNGLFTSHLLNNLKTAGLSVRDLFDKTGSDVRRASGGKQIPAIYSQYFETAYIGSKPVAVTPAPAPTPTPAPAPSPALANAVDYYNRGKSYYDKKDYDRAIADFTEAIRVNPQYATAYNDRGASYSAKKDYDRAIADYTAAIRLNPQYAIAYYNRGNSYYDKKDYDRAIADYTEAIRLNPQYASAYYNRGNLYRDKKDYDRAIADYTEAIRLNPQFANAYYNRGLTYFFKNDYDRAIADNTEVIRIDPQYANAYHNRGAAYFNKSDYDRAIADYEAALRIDPNHALAKNNLEMARQKRGR
ncbi:hypothetical protein AGMMS49928_13270 [Spirochaetia bacterium]|nr:hypothetical protein AGMMS49928_13270 [Spirochaetia bacterium]